MKRLVLLIVTGMAMAWMTTQAQTVVALSGQIVDAESGTGLAGVTFKVKPAGKTTLTDAEGHYRWALSTANLSDSVQISCIGYQTISRTVNELKSAILMLSPQLYKLPEITFQQRKPRTKILNGYTLKRFGERERIPNLAERQTDMIGRHFILEHNHGQFSRIRSVQIFQEAVKTSLLSYFRSQQHWRFRLRILEADENGRPTDKDLLAERVIITVSDVDYQVYDRVRYDPATNSTLYTNHDFSEKMYFGVINIDLRRYDVPYPTNGVFVFLELLPPVIAGGDRLFCLAKMDVGNSGWFLDGRTRQWSRGVHFLRHETGVEEAVNIEPAIALELME